VQRIFIKTKNLYVSSISLMFRNTFDVVCIRILFSFSHIIRGGVLRRHASRVRSRALVWYAQEAYCH
jgi:hypothetical protein